MGHVYLGHILPLQAVADHGDDSTDHPPVIHRWHALGQCEVPRDLYQLAWPQQKQITYQRTLKGKP
jgi:hypothetical protein